MSKAKHKLSEKDQLITQGWHTLVDSNRLLRLYPSSNESDKSSEGARLLECRQQLDVSIDLVNLLLRLQKGETLLPYQIDQLRARAPSLMPPAPPALTVSVDSPGPSSASLHGSGPQTAGVKRKYRQSISASPAPPSGAPRDELQPPASASRHASPLPGANSGAGTGSAAETGPLAGSGGKLGAPTMARQLTKKNHLQDQSALQPGRPVAYKHVDPSAETTWILCRVVRGDRNKYEVEDTDETVETGSRPRYNTTLRNLIPLPDESLPLDSPAHPRNMAVFAPGTRIFALYPNTTSFYEGTVIAPPERTTVHGSGPRKGAGSQSQEDEMYKLSFIDDDGVYSVERNMVIAYPDWAMA